MKICRHRLGCDGRGVTTLVAYHGCPLNCKYCINDECHCDDTERMYLSPQKLLDIVRIDDIYFRMTEGGITFGGGEPLLHVDYLLKFARLMLPGWKLSSFRPSCEQRVISSMKAALDWASLSGSGAPRLIR